MIQKQPISAARLAFRTVEIKSNADLSPNPVGNRNNV
ncbi:hypothetical protein ABID20_000304 [Rhizobium alvei]